MKKYTIGVDLGGTKIEAAIVSNDGALIDRSRIATDRSKNADQLIIDIENTVKLLSHKHPDIPISALGIGVAGQVERNTGLVLYAPNLGWHDVNIGEQLSNTLRLPVAVCNDVRAAAWGEWQWGSGKGCDDLVCLFVGTGIGGAIICSGKMVEGCNNSAGELGHLTLNVNGPQCTCGNKGCFEAMAGGWAIQRDAQQAVQNDLEGGRMLISLAGGDVHSITAKTVVVAALKGDLMANKLIDNVTDSLIAGVTSIANIMGPCRIILGGGIIEGMPQLIRRIEHGVRNAALKAALHNLQILPAKLHDHSGSIGAATFAAQMLT